MTGFFQTKNWSSQPQNPQEALDLNMQIANKENWRIVQLVNGFYQTEYQSLEKGKWIDVTRRQSIEEAEQAINAIHGTDLGGRILAVNEARPLEEKHRLNSDSPSIRSGE